VTNEIVYGVIRLSNGNIQVQQKENLLREFIFQGDTALFNTVLAIEPPNLHSRQANATTPLKRDFEEIGQKSAIQYTLARYPIEIATDQLQGKLCGAQ
jgi:hypothetical protein